MKVGGGRLGRKGKVTILTAEEPNTLTIPGG